MRWLLSIFNFIAIGLALLWQIISQCARRSADFCGGLLICAGYYFGSTWLALAPLVAPGKLMLRNPFNIPPNFRITNIVIRAPVDGSIWKSQVAVPITKCPGSMGRAPGEVWGPLSCNGADEVVSTNTQLGGWNWKFERWIVAGDLAEFPIPHPSFAAQGFYQFVPESQYCCLPPELKQ